MQTIYVDNNATTAIAPEVVAAMQPFFTADYFNPSSMYDAARSAAHAIRSPPARPSPAASAASTRTSCSSPARPPRATTPPCSAASRPTRSAGT